MQPDADHSCLPAHAVGSRLNLRAVFCSLGGVPLAHTIVQKHVRCLSFGRLCGENYFFSLLVLMTLAPKIKPAAEEPSHAICGCICLSSMHVR